jgi:hypothetical protein
MKSDICMVEMSGSSHPSALAQMGKRKSKEESLEGKNKSG